VREIGSSPRLKIDPLSVLDPLLPFIESEVELDSLNDQAAPIEAVERAEPARPFLLLVEDDWRTHSALRKILGKLGWEVQSAMTVSGGLALLDLKPDALVLDLMLPDGDGAEVLRKARAESPSTKVAVTTGVEDFRRLEEIRDLQPDALLRKPLELGDLLRVLGTERPV
jgi:CheY-like chemotaxis protein